MTKAYARFRFLREGKSTGGKPAQYGLAEHKAYANLSRHLPPFAAAYESPRFRNPLSKFARRVERNAIRRIEIARLDYPETITLAGGRPLAEVFPEGWDAERMNYGGHLAVGLVGRKL